MQAQYRQHALWHEGDRTTQEKVDVEVILMGSDELGYNIKTDEDAIVQRISRSGVKLVEKKPHSVVLRMSENKAITHNLV